MLCSLSQRWRRRVFPVPNLADSSAPRYARTAPMLLGAVWPTIPAALPESVSPADLVGSGRDAEAAEQLRGAIALRPFDAEAYRLLGGLLGERWERRALRTRSTDFGVRESDVPEPELRAEAKSVQLQPSAHTQWPCSYRPRHAAGGRPPAGRADSRPQRACWHNRRGTAAVLPAPLNDLQ